MSKKTSTGSLGYSRASDKSVKRKRAMAYKKSKRKDEKEKQLWK